MPIRKIICHASQNEFSRYFWVGSLTFLTDFLILFVLTDFAGINYLWSNLAGVCVGIVMSYVLCVRWVFLDRRYNQVTLEFPVFVLICLIGLLANELMLWAAVEFGGVHYLVSKVGVSIVIFVFNYFFKKIVLFQKS